MFKVSKFIHIFPVLLAPFSCDAPPQSKLPETPTSSTAASSGSGGADALGAPGKSEPGVTSDCQAWTSLLDGPWRYVNDQWGADKAQAGFEQCLLRRDVTGDQQIGWTWSWPGFDPSVFAFPSATFGWKPWAGGTPTDARFPMRVADLVMLELSYEVETSADGAFNLAAEIWLTSEAPSAFGANPSIITSEVMFWLEQTDTRPAGAVVDQPTVGGTEYELWKEANIGKDANGQGWTILSFKASAPRRQGVVPIHTFIEYLVDKGELRADEYVASVEFGNELSGGAGTTWVKQLEVKVQP